MESPGPCQPGRGQWGPGGGLPPAPDGGHRAPPSLTSAAGLEEALAPDVSCGEPVTIATPCPGTKLPGGRDRRRSRQSRKTRGPSRRTPSRASVPARNEPCSPSFQRRLLGTYTLLGLLFLPTLSLPVSMATPPNSRFQAAMTSPFPFLPPRPGGTAALGWARASQRLQPDPRPLGHSWRALGPSRLRAPPGPWSGCDRAPSRAQGPGATCPPAPLLRFPALLAAWWGRQGRRAPGRLLGQRPVWPRKPSCPRVRNGDCGRGLNRRREHREGLWPGR